LNERGRREMAGKHYKFSVNVSRKGIERLRRLRAEAGLGRLHHRDIGRPPLDPRGGAAAAEG
jgi:hypothetical protein